MGPRSKVQALPTALILQAQTEGQVRAQSAPILEATSQNNPNRRQARREDTQTAGERLHTSTLLKYTVLEAAPLFSSSQRSECLCYQRVHWEER